jgi:predicted O-linked N-acetylglucosamine transferase (SPINDLY family)
VAGYRNGFGAVLAQRGRFADAVDQFREAIQLDRDYLQAWENLGRALADGGAPDEGAAVLVEAIEHFPAATHLYHSLAIVFVRAGHFGKAVAALRELAERDPADARAWSDAAPLLQALARPSEAVDAYRRALGLCPDDAKLHSRLLYALHYDQRENESSIYAEHVTWAQTHAVPIMRSTTTDRALQRDNSEGSGERDHRIRVGYISADFRDHPVPRFFESIVASRDRQRFQVFFYSDVRHEDAETQRLKRVPDAWRNITDLSDEAVADLMRSDRLDILVDPTGHMDGARALLLARKAAPVQCLYPGYPNTSGVAAVDYFLTDFHKDPPHLTRRVAERSLLRLQPGSMCYRPGDAPPVNDLPALSNGYVTFGVMNRLEKVTDPMIELWARIIAGMRGARLFVLVGRLSRDCVETEILPRFVRLGIPAGQLDLVQSRPRQEYLKVYHRIDLLLDTYPYHGCSTTCDALWMGVPVVTLAGTMHMSRVGVSLLNSAGLPHLVAGDAEEYVRIAVGLASDLSKLRTLRAALRVQLRTSPLVDPMPVAKAIERAFLQM